MSSASAPVFVCYSRKDDGMMRELREQLAALERTSGFAVAWCDLDLKPGDWKQQVMTALAAARVGILLVSASFLASEFINSVEFPELVKASEGGLKLIPVLLADCLWGSSPGLRNRQFWPRPLKALYLMEYGERQSAWAAVAAEVQKYLDIQCGPPPAPGGFDRRQQDYISRLGEFAARELQGVQPHYNLEVERYKSFAHLERRELGEAVSLSDLVDQPGSDAVLLHGAGGSGKTRLLTGLIGKFISKGWVPLLFDTKSLEAEEDADNDDSLFDALVRTATIPIDPEVLENLWGSRTIIILVDSFNELSRHRDEEPLQRRLFRALNKQATAHPSVKILIADRIHPRQDDSRRYIRTLLAGISQEDLRRICQDKGVDFDGLDSATQSILRMPMFLNMWLGETDRGVAQKAGLLQAFVADHKLSEAALKCLPALAFQVYRVNRSLVFGDKDLVEVGVSTEAINDLRQTSLLQSSLKVGDMRFSHQVVHDYFAALYVASLGPDKWDYDTLDSLSLDGEDRESIYLALEVLEGSLRDIFLQKVYDWNYPIALFCLRDDALFRSEQGLGQEIKLAVVVSVAVKQFDFFPHTRRWVRSALRGLPNSLVRRFLVDEKASEKDGLAQITAAVRSAPSAKEWFNFWRDLVAGSPRCPDLALMNLIGDDNPFIGWAMANALREWRDQLEIQHWWWLLGYLKAATHTVQYRIVHALGAARLPEAIDALTFVAETEAGRRQWVAVGAVRSLVEIGARNPELRPVAFKNLKDLAKMLSWLGVRQLTRTIDIDSPDENWKKSAADLLRHYRDTRGNRDNLDWQELLEKAAKSSP